MFWAWIVAIALQIFNNDHYPKTKQEVLQFSQVILTHSSSQYARKTYQESY